MTIATVVTSMKDEAPYVLEWVAYHKSIGFDRIVVMANDCTDGTYEMLGRLRDLGIISFYENIVPLGAKPHSLALKKANSTEEVKTSDYVMVLDADEFLVVKKGRHNVKDLIAAMQDREASMMVVPWRIFGCSHQYTYDDRPVIERFTLSMDATNLPKAGVKTLFKQSDALRLAIHFPKRLMKGGKSIVGEDQFKWIDPDGIELDGGKLTWNGGRNKISRSVAEVAHFMIKSLDEYMLKIFRGDGLMNSNRHGIDYWKTADKNEANDLSVIDNAPEFRDVFHSFIADAELKKLHDIAVSARMKRLSDILDNPQAVRLREILRDSAEGDLRQEQIVESRTLVSALSPKKVPGKVLEGKIPASFLLSITSVGVPEMPQIAKSISGSCRENSAMFWYEKDFAKRPITSLIDGLKNAQKDNREFQAGVRIFDNFTKKERADDWPLDKEVTVLLTRPRTQVYAGFAKYVAASKAQYLEKKQRAFPSLRSVISGKENGSDIEALITQKKIEDPYLRAEGFVERFPDTIVLDLDDRDGTEKILAKMEARGAESEVFAKVLRDGLKDVLKAAKGGKKDQLKKKDPVQAKDKKRRVVTPDALRVYWFRRGKGNAKGNFGDELGPLLVKQLSGRSIVWEDAGKCDLASIGSILSQVSKQATREKRKNELLVWGSGLIEEDIRRLDPCLRPLAVRGTATRDALRLRKDLPLGDPGILSNLLVEPVGKQHMWGIVPHFSQRKSSEIREIANANNCVVIDPTEPPEDVLRLISACEGIVSSSLHGLIVADSYQVPCYWLDLKSHKSHEYKFNDYCTGINRDMFPRLNLDDLGKLMSKAPAVAPFIIPESIKQNLSKALTTAI